MTQPAFEKTTKFFRSFTANSMPVVPVDEVNIDGIDQLASFYAADFDESGSLIRYRKFLNVEDAAITARELVFDDQYFYSNNGQLEARSLHKADGSVSHWFFGSSAETDRWRDYGLAHDQLTELEAHVNFDLLATDLRGNEFTVSSVRAYLNAAEQVMRNVTQDPRCVFMLLIPGSDNGWLQLHPPDVFDTAFADIAMMLKPTIWDNGLPLLYPNPRSLENTEYPAADPTIRALAALPVRIQHDDQLSPIGVFATLACRDWPEFMSQRVMSLMKRIAAFIELLIAIGQRDDGVARRGNTSSPLEHKRN